jgi:hypothetical protein
MQMRYFRTNQPCADAKEFQIDEQSPGSRQDNGPAVFRIQRDTARKGERIFLFYRPSRAFQLLSTYRELAKSARSRLFSYRPCRGWHFNFGIRDKKNNENISAVL